MSELVELPVRSHQSLVTGLGYLDKADLRPRAMVFGPICSLLPADLFLFFDDCHAFSADR